MDKNFFPALECVAINSTGFSPWHEVHAVAGCVKPGFSLFGTAACFCLIGQK
jgi:hypothetical protein